MESALLLFGVVAFSALTLNYLKIAFQTANIWFLLGLLFPPSCIAFYVQFWGRYKPQAVLHGVSLVALILFSAIYIRAYPFEFEQTALSPLRNVIAPAYAESPLPIEPIVYATDAEMTRYLRPGRKRAVANIEQRTFRIDRAVVNNGIVRFKTKSKTGDELEVAVDLSEMEISNPNIIELDLTPEHTNLPTVYVIQHRKNNPAPSISVYDYGYWMEFSLNKMTNYQYDGFINLKLPDGAQSFVAGYFDAFDVDLVWDYGAVDRRHDSNHTIEYVAEQYLTNNLGSALGKVEAFHDTFFQTSLDEPSGRTVALLEMVDGSQQQVKLQLFKGDEGWTVEHAPVRELISALQAISKAPPASIRRAALPTQITVFSIDEVESLVGRSVVIVTQDGRVREGVVSAVDKYNVSLMNPMHGGSMAMLVRRREVKEIQLKD